MALLEWTEKMSVGVDAMDADHKKLIDLVNELHAVVRRQQPADSVARVLRDLMSYTDYHFQAEEQLLRLMRYPDLENHMQAHRTLLARAAEMESKFHENPKQGSVKLFDFLSDWLMRHILGEDMKYKPLLQEKLGKNRPARSEASPSP